MVFDDASSVLQRFPVFRTSDHHEFRNALLSTYGATDVEVRGASGFKAWANYVKLEQIALGSAGCSTDIVLHFPEMDYVRYQIAVSGTASTTTAGVTTEIDQSRACATSLGRSMRVSCAAGHERLTLRIKTAALDQKLAVLLGAMPNGLLEFRPSTDLDDPRARSLVRLIAFLAEQLDSGSAQLSPLMVRELEQAIIVQFLSATEHRYSRQLERQAPDPAPSSVRLAEEFIEAHWNEAITIEGLAKVTNVSARTLFRSFRRVRGYSPMSFARMARLKRARDMLAGAGPHTSVVAVALACGFASMGHFAGEYRRMFGELPSETLARAK